MDSNINSRSTNWVTFCGSFQQILINGVITIILSANILYLKSWLIGVSIIALYFLTFGYGFGCKFFSDLDVISKTCIGIALLLSSLSIVSRVALAFSVSGDTIIVVFLLCIYVISSLFVRHIRRQSIFSYIRQIKYKLLNLPANLFALIGLYIVSVITSIVIMIRARTPIYYSPWTTLNCSFVFAFAIESLLLVLVCIRVRSESFCLIFTILHALLSRSLVAVVSEPQPGGDNSWYDLAFSRAIERNSPLVNSVFNIPNLLHSTNYSISALVQSLEKSLKYTSNVLLSKMSSLDLLVINAWIVPVLSALLITVTIFQITRSISQSNNKSNALLVTILVVSSVNCIIYGAFPWANGLGVALFTLNMYMCFRWLYTNDNKSLVFAIFFAFSTAFVHYIPGIFAFSTTGIALALHFYFHPHRHIKWRLLSLCIFFLALVALPVSYLFYYRTTSFGLENFSITDFLDYLATTVTQDLSPQNAVSWVVGGLFFTLSLFGLFLFLRNRAKCTSLTRRVAFLLVCISLFSFVSFVIDITVVNNPPFIPGREHIFMYLSLGPFLIYLVDGLMGGQYVIKVILSTARRTYSFGMKRFAFLLVLLVVTFNSVGGVLYAYPRSENRHGRVTMLEYQSVLLIDKIASTPYVVLGDFNTRLAGSGAVGYLNPYALYLEPYNPQGDYFYSLLFATPELAVSGLLQYSAKYIEETEGLRSNVSTVYIVLSSYSYGDESIYFSLKTKLRDKFITIAQLSDAFGNEVVVLDWN